MLFALNTVQGCALVEAMQNDFRDLSSTLKPHMPVSHVCFLDENRIAFAEAKEHPNVYALDLRKKNVQQELVSVSQLSITSLCAIGNRRLLIGTSFVLIP